MSNKPQMDVHVREKIIADPEVLLEDQDVMRALVAANEQSMGSNIVDLRGIAMERLEARLDRLEDTLHDLSHDVADTLRVDVMKLVLETASKTDEPALKSVGDVLTTSEPGFADAYITRGRDIPVRQVSLRQVQPDDVTIYGDKADYIRSEACLKLDFGEGRLPGMLVMGSEDPHQFTPQQGTDLLTFFAGCFERAMRRWLS